MNLSHIIKRPVITEKSLKLASRHQFTFAVDPAANKHQIKDAIQNFFKVTVLTVKTMTMTGKRRRRPGKRSFFNTGTWKKAVVQLPSSQKIDLFEIDEAPPAKDDKKKSKSAPKIEKKEEKQPKNQPKAVAHKDHAAQKSK